MPRQRKHAYTKTTVLNEWACRFPSVLTWLQKLNGTKPQRAVNLSYFCEWARKDPEQLLELKANPACLDAERLVDRFTVESPFTRSTTWNAVTAVKSFFRKNYRQLQSECGKIDYVVCDSHVFPDLAERLDVYHACFNQRDRALVGVVFTSGLALETFSRLKWSHFETDWQRQDYPHISIPGELLKGHGLGKYKGVRQETFVTPLVKMELVKYRDWMTKQYGFVWQDGMNVFYTLARNHRTKQYEALTWNGLAGLIIDLSKRANVKFSIHDGRRIVETALESVGCPRNWIQKVKGRKVRGEDAPYSRPAIEQLRAKYREAVGELEFLSSSSPSLSLSDADRQILERFKDPAFQEKQKALEEAYELLSDPDVLEKLRRLKKVHFNSPVSQK
jgi:hypothetical protein